MVDWDKLFEGLFKAVATYGVDPVLVLVFLALMVAALLVSTVGLALWCLLALIKRPATPTSASSGDTRIVIEVRGHQDMQSKRLRQVLQQRAEEPQRGVLRHQQAERGGVLRHQQLRDRLRGAEDLPLTRRSFRWNRR